MKVRLFAGSDVRRIEYDAVDQCPLCGGPYEERARLSRTAYRFGGLEIPLPSVALRACRNCDLLFKSAMPTQASLSEILSVAAENEWRPKRGPHPSIPQILPYLTGNRDVLDVGASNGDLLRGVAGHAGRISALDAVAYPSCRSIVNAEYIISTFEEAATWSNEPYDLVTAFDVFEHFLDARRATTNLLRFLRPGGHLIIETGDWRSVERLEDWYYCNLFEHQIFWSARSLEYLAHTHRLELVTCELVNHKGRRNMSRFKRTAVQVFRGVGRFNGPLCARVTGIDPRLVAPPTLRDHLFAVLRRK